MLTVLLAFQRVRIFFCTTVAFGGNIRHRICQVVRITLPVLTHPPPNYSPADSSADLRRGLANFGKLSWVRATVVAH